MKTLKILAGLVLIGFAAFVLMVLAPASFAAVEGSVAVGLVVFVANLVGGVWLETLGFGMAFGWAFKMQEN